MTLVQTQQQQIDELKKAVFNKPRWVRIGIASRELGLSCSTLRRRCSLPQYRQGKCWKYFSNGRDRLFDVVEWRKAEAR